MGKSITMFNLFKTKYTNYLRTNTDEATFSINVPISKNFQTKFFWPPLSSNLSSVPIYGRCSEDVKHALWECEAVKSVWDKEFS